MYQKILQASQKVSSRGSGNYVSLSKESRDIFTAAYRMSKIKRIFGILQYMKDKIDLLKELMITGQISQDWILENILNMNKKSLRKEKIKKLFND